MTIDSTMVILRSLYYDTRVSGALDETIVDKGHMECLVPNTRRLTNSIDVIIQTADVEFAARNNIAFRLSNENHFINKAVEEGGGDIELNEFKIASSSNGENDRRES